MITPIQKQEVHDYLLSKKIPIDILIETEDHFVTQILDVQKEKNIGFNEAFVNVKDIWKDELEMKYNGLLHFYAPNFVMKIINREYYKTFKIALLLSVILEFLILFVAYFKSKETFLNFFLWISILVIFVPFCTLMFCLIRDYKHFRTNRRNVQYSIYQRNLIIILLSFFFLGSNVFNTEKLGNIILEFLKGERSGFVFLTLIIGGVFLTTSCIFGFLNLLQHKKVVHQLKTNYKKLQFIQTDN